MSSEDIPTSRAPQERTRRADAQRNYDRLLRAATDAFAEHGAKASLDDIARRAGVGNATLYRHFPTRQALLVAVSANEVQALCDEGERLRSSYPSGDALVQWLIAFVGHVSSKQGLAAALLSEPGETADVIAASNAKVRAVAATLVRDAQRARAVRADVDVDELLTLARAIAAASETQGSAQATRLLTLALEGIRADHRGMA